MAHVKCSGNLPRFQEPLQLERLGGQIFEVEKGSGVEGSNARIAKTRDLPK